MAKEDKFVSWIRKKLESGYTKDQLKDVVRSKGYPERYVVLIDNIESFEKDVGAGISVEENSGKGILETVADGLKKFVPALKVFGIVIVLCVVLFVIISGFKSGGSTLLAKEDIVVEDEKDMLPVIDDLSECFKLGSGAMEDCFLFRMKNNPDLAEPNICNMMTDENNADKCYYILATKKSYLDKDICDGASTYRPLCYQRLAIMRGEIAYCENAVDPQKCRELAG